MDDETMFEILSLFPSKQDEWIEEKDLGLSRDTILELTHLNLIIRKEMSREGVGSFPAIYYVCRLSERGSSWISNYHRQNRNEQQNSQMSKMTSEIRCMTLVILVLTAVSVLLLLWQVFR